ncbi:MAG: DUF86 domain-containing protein [Candidatus Helarchaeota archaeon]|nr:DUF86 domain-containing protein [Candidatus Helarchaeota archaeon]
MSKRNDKEFLGDIKEAVRRIREYTENINYKDFLNDIKTQDAVVRNFEVIGEAVKNLSINLRETHSKIPWKKIAGIKDKLIHHYFGVNFEILWTIIEEDLPDLDTQIKDILNEKKNIMGDKL